ncbi:sensor histidine kinase [Kibdelosporangium aridum]|uniref:sensor histidine kinase n=1 Tax=Kibdelosporangium aridum TaxID=2030 RepID=UPI0035EC22BC
MRIRLWPASMRASAALTATVACLGVFALGVLGLREYMVDTVLGSAKTKAELELSRITDAYRTGHSVNVAVTGDAGYEVVTDSGQSVVRSSFIARIDPTWPGLPPAPADASGVWETKTALRSPTHPDWAENRTYTVLGTVVSGVPARLVEPLGRTGDLAPAEPSTSTATYRLTVYMFVLPWDAIRTETVFNRSLRFILPLAVVFVAGLAWFVTGRTLRPVEAIRRELAGVSEHNLDRRVPVPRSLDEIAKLARTTNATLDRLQAFHHRQQQFVADASHELRSPLTNLRAGLEVALAHADRADWPEVARQSLQDIERLQDLTADLLLLAVNDNSSVPMDTLVDLAALVEEFRPQVTCIVPEQAFVHGNASQLKRLLRNLVDNATRHARSTVTVTVRVEELSVVLEVLDDGPGIAPEDRERVFERFTRLDDARTRDSGGSGLGLTIARGIATRHGGSLTIEDSPTGGGLFVARFPR